jgi:hypothetical protein
MGKRVRGLLTGLAAAVLPLVAAAQEVQDRALPAATDWHMVMFLTAAVIAGLLVLAGIGYLYRRERHLDWEFQKPDQPHAGGEH